MSLQAEEEETIEALKKWWDENGKQLVANVNSPIPTYCYLSLNILEFSRRSGVIIFTERVTNPARNICAAIQYQQHQSNMQ